jgi:hypothetical protein
MANAGTAIGIAINATNVLRAIVVARGEKSAGIN